FVGLGTRFGPADPTGLASRCRGLAIEGHRPLAQHPRPIERQCLLERHVDLITLRRQDTIEHIDAGFLEHCDALATMARVGIDTADDHPLDASCDQGLCARRRLLAIDALLAGARLEGYH